MLLASALILALQFNLPDARNGPPPPPLVGACELGDAVRTDSMSQLPDDVRAELLRFFKSDFGEAGGPFNSSDVVSFAHPVPQRRFLRAYQKKENWIIWYEHGGVGYHLHAVGVKHPRSSTRAVMDPFSRYTGGTARELCAASKAFFDGAQTSFDL